MKTTCSEEAARIATRLRARAGDDRVFVFTSGGPGEATGTAASEVAIAFARLDAGPVLLVDAALDEPACHARFDAPRSPGLAEILRGQAATEQAIHSTSVERLAIVPAGGAVEDRLALLSGTALPSLFAHARGRFAWVIANAPDFPRSATSAFVATLADGVVLVVAAGAHSRTEVHDMQRDLRGLRARLVGTILSGAGR